MSSYSGLNEFSFISYSHKNSSKVQEILQKLSARGVRYWYDENLTPSDEYIEVIADKIMKSSFFIAFISNDSINSRYCKDEIRFAYENGKDMMILYLEPCTISAGYKMMLNGVQSYNIYGDFDNSMIETVFSGIPSSVVDDSGEKIYETDGYSYYFTSKTVGNGYRILRKNKANGRVEQILQESFPPASDFRINYVTRHKRFCNYFEISIGVTWDFTYTGNREDEFFDECYLYTVTGVNDPSASVIKKTLWRHDHVTDEHIEYDSVKGVNSITNKGKLAIKGTDLLGNKWDIE